MSTFRACLAAILRHMPSRGRFGALAALLTVGIALGLLAPSASATEYRDVRATVVQNDASAYAQSSTIQLKGTVAGDRYEAFRLLDATAAGDKVAYTVNSKYESLLRSVIRKLGNVDVTTSAQIVAWIAALPNESESTGQSVTLEQFAGTVYEHLEPGKYKSDATAEHKNGFVTFTVPQGYYLFHQTVNGANSGQTDSAFILDTVGDGAVSVNAKNETVSLTKKVKDDDTNGTSNTALGADGYTKQWLDAADFGAGDRFTFQLTGTLPADYDEFATFKYVFHDEPAKGLDIQVNDKTNTIRVYVDNDGVREEVTWHFTVPESIPAGTQSFTVGIDDLKTLGNLVNAKSKIVLEYDAKLNTSSSEIGVGSKGNPNKARVEFSSDAHIANSNATRFTPYDLATVFTYQLRVTKSFTGGAPATMPTFTLYEWDEAKRQYSKLGSNTVKPDTKRATFVGVDEGRYKLVESDVPAGYNKADDVYFTVTATHDVQSENPQLAFLQTTLTDENGNALFGEDGQPLRWAIGQSVQESGGVVYDGVILGEVENVAGSELPSTGGNGVRMFYVAGGLVMALAMIGLVRAIRNR